MPTDKRAASSVDSWLSALEAMIESYRQALVSAAKFDRDLVSLQRLGDCPLSGILVRIEANGGVAKQEAGIAGQGEPHENSTVTIGIGTARVLIWRDHRHHGADINRIIVALKSLVTAYWKPDLRNDKSQLIFAGHINAAALIDAYLDTASRTGSSCALMFCDMDKFKEINDKRGEQEGDRVIGVFAGVLCNATGSEGIALHRSGDEFLVLLPFESEVDVLKIASQIAMSVRSTEFGVGDLPVSVSSGIALQKAPGPVAGYKSLEKRAHDTLKPPGGGKRRGAARLESRTASSTDPFAKPKEVAITIIRALAGVKAPFANAYLNLVSDTACAAAMKGTLATIGASAREILGWIKPDYAPNVWRCTQLRNTIDDSQPTFSCADAVLAVAHGIVRAQCWGALAGIRMSLVAGDDGSHSRLIDAGTGEELLALGAAIEVTPIDLGAPPVAPVNPDSEFDVRRLVLVRIGQHKLSLPVEVFQDVVYVDDRPAKGGGLPDFWEAALARLISIICNSQHIDGVFVAGNLTYGRETITRLKEAREWPEKVDAIAKKTSASTGDIKLASARLLDRLLFEDSAELADEARRLHQGPPIPSRPKASDSARSPQLLQRTLDLAGHTLTPQDGCRVDTVAAAYPIVLEIVRKSAGNRIVGDQAGRASHELVDFKVRVATPSRDLIPEFYETEADKLESYYLTQFERAGGLFFDALAAQRDSVLAHVRNAILTRRSTRRGVLIVPHEPRAGSEISPLGLVSVRINPVYREQDLVLEFSVTWRTVEALVGFPYSLYASARFADHLRREIVKGLEEMPIGLGALSYVAHSLHYFVDDYTHRIAKQIVDAASD